MSELGPHAPSTPKSTAPEQTPASSPEAATATSSPDVSNSAGLFESDPRRIGRYSVRRRIGAGGMGVVYEAEQDQPKRVVALKVMRPGRDSSAAFERFRREAEILGRLRHPGIAQVIEAGTHKDDAGTEVPYFAMEYVPGATTLTDYAKAHALDIRARIEIFAKVCDAVQHAHRAGIVHRDLKPENVLVDDSGDPRIIDFGIARAPAAVVAERGAITMPQAVIGTLAYMSPEQWSGDPASVGSATDVYALGATLYELLTGRRPHNLDGLSLSQMSEIVREERPARPSAHNPALRGDLDVIVLKAMHPDPSRRYASPGSLAEDIRRWLDRRPIEARTDEFMYRARMKAGGFLGRHKVVAWALGSLAAAAVTYYFGAPFLHQWTRMGGLAEGMVMRAAAWGRGTRATGDSVRVIALTEGTDASVLALNAGVAGFDPSDPTSGRRLHGRLMERLAKAKPEVVVFEIAFSQASAHDPEFVAGARALANANVPLVVGVSTWDLSESGTPRMSPAILPHCAWGTFSAGLGPNAPWRLDLAVKRAAQGTLPSLALATLAAKEGLGVRVIADLDQQTATIWLRAWEPDSTSVGGRRLLKGGRIVRCSAVYSQEKGDSEFGIEPDDLIAALIVDPPSIRDANAVTIDYASALRMTDAGLEAAISGKVIIIADHRHGRVIRTTPDGRRLQGTFAHCAGIEALLNDSAIVMPPEGPVEAAIHGWAAAGAVIGAMQPRRAGKRWARVSLLLASIAVVSIVLLAGTRVLIGPLVPIVAAMLGSEITAALLRLRTA